MFDKIKKFIHQEAQKVGSFFNGHHWESNGQKLEEAINKALAITTSITAVIENNQVKDILDTITKGQSKKITARITAALDKVATDLTIGSSIQKQVETAKTTEAKLKILFTAMQTYGPERVKMFLQYISAYLAAAIDNKQLPHELYAFYINGLKLSEADLKEQASDDTDDEDPDATPAAPAAGGNSSANENTGNS